MHGQAKRPQAEIWGRHGVPDPGWGPGRSGTPIKLKIRVSSLVSRSFHQSCEMVSCLAAKQAMRLPGLPGVSPTPSRTHQRAS